MARIRAGRTNGNLSRTEGLWQRLLKPSGGGDTITYILGPMNKPAGYVILRTATREGGVPQPLVSTDLAVNSPPALQRLFALIHDHRSMCDSFQWYGPPQDPVIFFADEQWVSVTSCMRWMLRVIDLPAALSQRGYNPSFNGTLDFEIEDELLVENSGRWRLTIESGTATVGPGGEGKLRMNIRALAPLYSSYYRADQLAQLGVIRSSDDRQLTLATQAFAGDAPWLPELY